MSEQSSFSPPVPQGGVNPLGGTMAADAGAFASVFSGNPQGQGGFGPPPGAPTTAMPAGGGPPGFGPPPGGQQPYGAAPYGAPPQQDPQYAQNPYGAPPQQQAYGQPQPYGQPPQQQGGWGPPQGMQHPQGMQQPGMMNYGQPGQFQAPGAMGGTLQSAGTVTGPTKRNALMTFLVPAIVIFGGAIAGTIVAIVLGAISPGLAVIGTLISMVAVVAGAVMYILSAIKMTGEIKSVTRNDRFAWWPILVPVYNYYWLWLLVPAEVTKAKQMMGIQAPTRSIVLYIFLWHFALASDINDIAR